MMGSVFGNAGNRSHLGQIWVRHGFNASCVTVLLSQSRRSAEVGVLGTIKTVSIVMEQYIITLTSDN